MTMVPEFFCTMQFRLRPSERQLVRDLARQQDVSMSEAVRRLIAEKGKQPLVESSDDGAEVA
jgi:hypothetical protein